MDFKEQNAQKKEYLKLYRSAVTHERILIDEIERLQADEILLNVVSDDLDPVPSYKDHAEYAVKLDESVVALKEQRLKKMKIYTDIQQKVLRIEDDTEKSLLILKYLQGKSWEQVAFDLSYSRRGIYKVHERALQHFQL